MIPCIHFAEDADTRRSRETQAAAARKSALAVHPPAPCPFRRVLFRIVRPGGAPELHSNLLTTAPIARHSQVAQRNCGPLPDRESSAIRFRFCSPTAQGPPPYP